MGLFYEPYNLIGNPAHPLINPDVFMSLNNKLNANPFGIIFRHTSYYLEYVPIPDKLARKYIGNEMPYLGDVAKQYCSLFLTN